MLTCQKRGPKIFKAGDDLPRKIAATERHTTSYGTLNGNAKAALSDLETEVTGDETGLLLKHIEVGTQSIDDYYPIVGEQKVDELKSQAARLNGARILHINSTAYGGGVAELLRSHIPLLRSLGIDSDWMVIRGDDTFFGITKAFHNALQGGEYVLDSHTKEVYLANNSRNARYLDGDYDYIVVHDPQPAAMRLIHGGNRSKWVWRCHIDTSNPHPEVWQFLQPYVEAYDAMVYTMDQYVARELPSEKISFMPPAIDPLSPKNLPLPRSLGKKIISWVGIDTDRPLITQVSRFDPWKDPLGVIEVYRKVREQVPGVQLAMLGHLAMDDPQGMEMYEQVLAACNDDPDIYTFTNFTAASSIEVNAFQHYSDVIIQKSIREGFGLVVSEALWKGTPVVAGRAGGIPLQLEDGKDGFLIDTVDECAEKVLYLLQHPSVARKMGLSGRRHIRDNFLTPRLLHDELSLLNSLK